MTNYNHINKNHTIFLFLLSLFFLILSIDIQVSSLTVICFFLIATIGVSHGSLDHIKGRKLLNILKIDNIYFFYSSYIFLGLTIIILWLLFPATTLIFFLIVASYHFGKEDTNFLINNDLPYSLIFPFFKGLLIIIAPLNFHFEETLQIFKILFG